MNIVKRIAGSNWVIVSNTLSLVGAVGATFGLGFVYWWAAARLFPQEAVGLAAALVSAMTLLGYISVLGLGTLLIGEIPRQPKTTPALISTALLLAGAFAVVLGVGAALIAPHFSKDLAVLSGDLGAVVLFSAGVSFTALALVLDEALVGLLRSNLRMWRNAIFSVVKLLGVGAVGLWFAHLSGLGIYAAWIAGIAVSFVGLALITRPRVSLDAIRPQWSLLKGLRRKALWHHILNLSLQFPDQALPIVITVVLSPEANANFYIAWTISQLVFAIPIALTTVLYAVGSGDPQALAQRIRFTFGFSLLSGALASGCMVVAAEFILSFFGETYAQEATVALRILPLSVFMLIVKDHYIALARIQDRMAAITPLMIFASFLELVVPSVGAILGGLVGVSVGWLVALTLEVFIMAPRVYSAARSASAVPQAG